MRKIIFFSCMFMIMQFFAQERLIINGAYMVMSGGTATLPIRLVIENSASNAITDVSACSTPCVGTSGIVSESEFNQVLWKQANTATSYKVPFSKGKQAYIPLTFSMSQAASPAGAFLIYATTPVQASNLPLPTQVQQINFCSGNSGYGIVDRYWFIKGDNLQTQPSGTLEFTYIPSEYMSPNVITESKLGAFRYNTTLNKWNDIPVLGNPSGLNTSKKTLTTPVVSSTDFFQTWTLGSESSINVSTGKDTMICKNDKVILTANGATSYEWYLKPSTTVLATTASITVSPNATSNYVVLGKSGTCSGTDTIAVVVKSLPSLTITPSTTILKGETEQLLVSGGGTYNWLNTGGLSCVHCADPIASPTSTTEYCVEVTATNQCKDTACTTISIDIECGEVFIPTGFSPNNDGKNDNFLIELKPDCLKSFHLLIYNRLGEIVFESAKYDETWDGSYLGKPLNAGVFVYSLQLQLAKDESNVIRKGNITLIK